MSVLFEQYCLILGPWVLLQAHKGRIKVTHFAPGPAGLEIPGQQVKKRACPFGLRVVRMKHLAIEGGTMA
jgi:hypothetical protein